MKNAADHSLFYFSVLCDCEALQHAINDAELGERATRGLSDVLEANGLRGTFYVIPPDMEAHGALYRELEERGHDVGVHIHAAEQGAGEFLGVLDVNEQRRVLSEAYDRYAQVMGHAPTGICLGYGSANDNTYSIIHEVGFRHGTASVPGRALPQCASVWAGAPLGMHYAHRHYRVLPGDLDFVEIPNTLDPESMMWGGRHPQDLRVELVDAKNHWYTIDKSVARQLGEQPAVSYIRAATHNIFEYGDENNFRRQTLLGIIEGLKDVCEKRGVQWQGATDSQMACIFRERVPLSAQTGTLELDTRGRNFNKP